MKAPPTSRLFRGSVQTARDARLALGFLLRLRRFLGETTTLEQARATLPRRIAARETTFLSTLERGVFARPRSVYGQLFEHAGVELGDARALLASDGVEGTLDRFEREGIRLSLAELRCRTPIVRGSLRLTPGQRDFDSPFTVAATEAQGGGSRSAGTRARVDLDAVRYESVYHVLVLDGLGALGRPTATWYPAPPGIAGFKNVLHNAAIGQPSSHWFSQTPLGGAGNSVAETAFLRSVGRVGRRRGTLPLPEHVDPSRAVLVAQWCAAKVAEGRPPLLGCTPSSAVRVVAVAAEHGLEIAGTAFRCGGEPLTAGKLATVTAAGCKVTNGYFSTEAGGWIGAPCTAPSAPGEVHVVKDRLGLIVRPRMVGEQEIDSLVITTLGPGSHKLVINLEVDDYAQVGRRDCGCPFGELGLDTHLHTIRSHEKLMSEGMNFRAEDLVVLVEEVLPRRFGGTPVDYQLAEREVDGVTRLQVRVHPRLGAIDEPAVVDAVYETLAAPGRSERMMSDLWRRTGTVAVVREPPVETRAGKTLLLDLA